MIEDLATARRENRRLQAYPGTKPATLNDAYAAQSAVIDAVGGARIGWKIGVTSQAAQTALGVDHPISAPLLDMFRYESGAHIPVDPADIRIVEPEICVRMGADVPAGADRATLRAAIDAVAPSLELVNKRLPGGVKDAVEWLVADGAMNRGAVLGDFLPFQEATELTAETVQAFQNDTLVSEGVGANAMGDPLNVIAWLAEHLQSRGTSLKAGEIVMTGLICDVLVAEPGDSFRAEFGTLGTVSARF